MKKNENKKAYPFSEADILLPKKGFEKWAVIACDQFTSDPEYWAEVKKTVGDEPSTYHITLPEIYLEDGDTEKRTENINRKMVEYIQNGVFDEFKDAMIYVERTQPDGRVRKGIIGKVDLECYDYHKGSKTLIRATEGTVLERIPPRVKIRKNAPIELPHILMLINNKDKNIIEPLAEIKETMKKLYDFDLMQGSGHIKGYLIGKENVQKIKEIFSDASENEFLFAVGDGNHSLATAKECYEQYKKEVGKEKASKSNARYALVEIENIFDDALDFEPIYRVMFNVDGEKVLSEIKKYFTCQNPNSELTYLSGNKKETIKYYIPEEKVSAGVIQEFIDKYIKENPGTKVDYIHGVEDIEKLSKKENTVGFLFDGIKKETLFDDVNNTGALPRKTFSMGEGRDKRFYIECRKIK